MASSFLRSAWAPLAFAGVLGAYVLLFDGAIERLMKKAPSTKLYPENAVLESKLGQPESSNQAVMSPVNAYIRQLRIEKHHPIFSTPFKPWKGYWDLDSGYITDFTGATWKKSIYCNPSYMIQKVAHALRTDLCLQHDWLTYLRRQNCSQSTSRAKCIEDNRKQFVKLPWPVVGEEYFEYIDVFTSVMEHVKFYSDSHPYTFVEIGAGYGHWTATAATVLRQTDTNAKFRGLAIEFDKGKKGWIEETLEANSLSGSVELRMIGVGKEDEEVKVGESLNYGARPCPKDSEKCKGSSISKIRTLDQILFDFDHIAMVDIDVQGIEDEIFTEAAMKALNKKVVRVHIGTHSALPDPKLPHLFEKIVGIFTRPENNWQSEWAFKSTSFLCRGLHHFRDTPFGPVCFADGVASFVNPRFKHLSVR